MRAVLPPVILIGLNRDQPEIALPVGSQIIQCLMRNIRLHHHPLLLGLSVLSPEESHHATASLRLGEGQTLELFDGCGKGAQARILRVDQAGVQVQIDSISQYPFDMGEQLTLAVAPPRNPRQGYLVEKCTELGVAAIWPMETKRSVALPSDHALEKWRRRALEAAKQSGRFWVPQIKPVQSFKSVVEQSTNFKASALAHNQSDAIPIVEWMRHEINQGKSEVAETSSRLVLVGPEGGWEKDELDLANKHGLELVTLSPTILRSETAAVTICAALAMIHPIPRP